jgi:glyoxylase-like metal-dependent hydrolase (beta-lactamase superfamily II)
MESEFGYVPDETSWESVASLLQSSPPFFENILFLQGYEFSSNIFLIKGDYLSIIDPGNDYTAFMDLFALGYKPPDIKKIVITHGHQDHAGGAIEIFRGYRGYKDIDLEVILHEATSKQLKATLRDLGARLTEVKGGEILNLGGFEMEVIHTPGHTVDGICLYHAPSRTLFSGDTVLPHAMAELDKTAGGRLDHYLYAVRTLLKKDVENVMPGHGALVVGIGRLVIQDTYEGLIKKHVGLETPWMEGAATLAQQELLEEALFYSNKALVEDPEDMKAVEFKAFLLNDLGRSAEALEFFDRLLAHEGENLNFLLGKGAALMNLEKYEESLEFFDRALKLAPQSKEALIHKGMALYLAGRPEEAMDIEVFRTEFTGRFKEELLKSSAPPQ